MVCTAWKTLSYSAKSDSQETALEIIQQNARREVFCGS